MQARLPLFLVALALALFGAACALAGTSHSSADSSSGVQLTRVDVVVDGGFAYRHTERHITDKPRLRVLAQTLPSPLPASQRAATNCADCLETRVTVHAGSGAVRSWWWAENPPRSLQRFAKALSRMH